MLRGDELVRIVEGSERVDFIDRLLGDEYVNRRKRLISALNLFDIPHQNGWLHIEIRRLRNLSWTAEIIAAPSCI